MASHTAPRLPNDEQAGISPPSSPTASSVQTHGPRKGRGQVRRFGGEGQGKKGPLGPFKSKLPERLPLDTDLLPVSGSSPSPSLRSCPTENHTMAQSQHWLFRDPRSDLGGFSPLHPAPKHKKILGRSPPPPPPVPNPTESPPSLPRTATSHSFPQGGPARGAATTGRQRHLEAECCTTSLSLPTECRGERDQGMGSWRARPTPLGEQGVGLGWRSPRGPEQKASLLLLTTPLPQDRRS